MALVRLIFCTLLLLVFYYPSIQLAQGSSKLSPVDLNVLVSIKDGLTDLPGSSFFSSWDFNDPNPCLTFAGVTCALFSSFYRVTTLELGTGLSGSLGLAGSLPETVSDLGELTQLILNPGMVTGSIPSQLGRLKNLRVLFLSHNRLTGPIPPSIAELTQLHTMDLGFNRLVGPIPPEILTKLTRLKVLVLSGNSLSGELPASLSSLSLIHLDVKFNQLTGPVPETLPLTLRYVSLSHNLMGGPLNVTNLKSSPNLSYLDLSYNFFSGPLPPTFLRPSLSTLLLGHNRLSGEVASAGGGGVAVEYPGGATVDLSHNLFSGGLPEAAAGAENVFLNDNRFSGAIPAVYGDGIRNGVIKTLYLQHNFLDEFPKNAGGPTLPENAEVCLAYNCMVPPPGLNTCPASVGGGLVSRPAAQCSVFRNG